MPVVSILFGMSVAWFEMASCGPTLNNSSTFVVVVVVVAVLQVTDTPSHGGPIDYIYAGVVAV